ncbi:MAG: oligoendopeptidase F [Acidobacteria bacterium]|nr:oligoendopeptidase F [Acidobacteriota bacterium]
MTNENDISYRWNLEDIFPSDEAWAMAMANLEQELGALETCRGHLGSSARTLERCLHKIYELSKELRRVSAYAALLSDEDTRNARALEMRQSTELLATKFAQVTSFVKPEIIAIGREKLDAFLAEEPALAIYRYPLHDMLRQAPHTLGEDGEKLVATAGLMADAPSTVYAILSNAEIPWPEVSLSDGTAVHLDQAAYSHYRGVPTREDRRRVFEAFWKTWRGYQQTCGVTLYASVKRDLFYAQARRHPSCLEAALDGDNIPRSVYTTLLETANANLDTLHRYFRLRGRMLGIDDLQYFDIYPPLVHADLEFPIEEGERLVLESIEPLGAEYQATVEEGFSHRWMDVFPRPGKRSGAYSSETVYGVHPYVLLNYNNDYESVSTLAHEWGHSMHTFLANAAQPYPTASYSIFVAEVASTFNEALLLDLMLKKAQDDTSRLYFLGTALEGLRGTFFRQAMFAEFELEIHSLVERGEALSGERFSRIYGDLLRKYHGHDKGILTIDEPYTIEWAYIPHFYYNFYVYQYATSIAASSLFAERVLEDGARARDAYLAVLKAGGSDDPYTILKSAGADLASQAPYEALIRRMNEIMDQIEAILDRQPPRQRSPA